MGSILGTRFWNWWHGFRRENEGVPYQRTSGKQVLTDEGDRQTYLRFAENVDESLRGIAAAVEGFGGSGDNMRDMVFMETDDGVRSALDINSIVHLLCFTDGSLKVTLDSGKELTYVPAIGRMLFDLLYDSNYGRRAYEINVADEGEHD